MYLEINKWTIGPILATIALLAACFVKVANEGSWVDNLETLAVALLSALTFLFTDTVVEFLEDDKPHAEWFQEPTTWVKVTAGLSLVACTLILYDVV